MTSNTSAFALRTSSVTPSTEGQREGEEDFVLHVNDLKTHFHTVEGELPAVNGVTFSMRRGQILAIVGESGCGKSVTAYSILRLILEPGKIVGGQILVKPRHGNPIDVTALDKKSERLFALRGGLVSMIFQEPMTALSPVHTIGNQICEAILLHQDATNEQAEARAAEMLAKVGIPNPAERLRQYPFEMSGGMRQRAVIAMAMVCNPELLIADEPTTALDVTIQAQIMSLMKSLQRESGASILLITHDLGVVAQMADEVAVMYLGRIVEQADVRTVLKSPKHPYTMALLESLPSLRTAHEKLRSIKGSVPSLTEIPPGCPFHPRCDYYQPERCDVGGPPELRTISPAHKVACLRAEEITKDKKRLSP
ncbi:MAG: ABC transporter ATP-binding protein [Phycisphaerae bacterium]|nr:ABC transporter ATP-binding protein [Phycisphaerae bacterium]